MKNTDGTDVPALRLEICKSCEHLFKPTKTCTKCGCFMEIKTKLSFSHCPVHKWGKMDEENNGLPLN